MKLLLAWPFLLIQVRTWILTRGDIRSSRCHTFQDLIQESIQFDILCRRAIAMARGRIPPGLRVGPVLLPVFVLDVIADLKLCRAVSRAAPRLQLNSSSYRPSPFRNAGLPAPSIMRADTGQLAETGTPVRMQRKHWKVQNMMRPQIQRRIRQRGTHSLAGLSLEKPQARQVPDRQSSAT
jgi:hypothetical protein